MQIQKLELLEGASQAKGVTVIIDVFRAFSVACYIMNKNPKAYFLIDSVEEAIKKKNRDVILVGERNEKKPEGFDFGNSPSEIADTNLSNKIIYHTTTAGTQGVRLATKADEIILGSLVNAKAIADYIKKLNPPLVSLVSMGYRATKPSYEDQLCALYIESLLKNNEIDISKQIESLKQGDGSRFFEYGNQGHSPESDFYKCTNLNYFPFVLRICDKIEFRIQKI